MKKNKKLLRKFNKIKKEGIKFFHNRRSLYLTGVISIVIVTGVSVLLLNPKLLPNSDIYEVKKDEGGIFANVNPDFEVFFGKKDDDTVQWVRFEGETSNTNLFDPNYKPEKKNIIEKVKDIFGKDEKLGIEMSLSGVKLSETGSETVKNISNNELEVKDILGTNNIKTSTELLKTGRLLGELDNEQNISKKTVLNKNVWKGVDLEYQILEGIGVKEEIIIRSLESYMKDCKSSETGCEVPLNEFVFDLHLDDGVELHQSIVSVRDNPVGTYYFTDEKGNYLAHFLPCFAFDENGSRTNNVKFSIERTKEDGLYRVHVIADMRWILDSDRVFPIHIDPSIVHDDSIDFDMGILNRLEDATGPKVQLVEQELAADKRTVGLWHMNEDSGTSVTDYSDNGNTGTATGTTIVSGKFNNARSFNGSSDYIDVGSSINLANKSFTIESWAKRTSTGNYNFIIAQGSNSANMGLQFGFRSSNVFTCAFYSNDLNSPQAYTDAEWHYWVCTYDSRTKSRRMYRDGILVASDTASADYQGSGVMQIGRRPVDSTYYFSGVIDEVRISNVARTPEEIKASAKKGSYGVYISDAIDLTDDVTSIDDIQWVESGVNTGNGETPYSTTDLVAQWDFDETSGTTADNEGSCGSGCDGTLIDMTTTGQDAGIRTGWTAVNSKWGGGALMFDGSNDYVNVGDVLDMGVNDLSVETWIKTTNVDTANSQSIVSKSYYGPLVGRWFLGTNSGKVRCTLELSSGVVTLDGSIMVADGQWHYVACVFDRDGDLTIYVDGKYDNSIDISSGSSENLQTTMPLRIGAYTNTDQSAMLFFKGIIDSTKIYSRVLSSSEILSNYNSTNIEFLTRTSGDGNTWEEWKPSTGETQLNSFDDQYMYSTSQSGLVSYWPLDNDSGSAIDDVKGSNDGTATGTEIIDGVYSNGRGCDGVDDIILTGTTGRPTNNFTMEAWFTTNITHEIDPESTSSTTGTSGQNYLFGAYNMGADSGAGVSVGTNGISVYEHGSSYMPPLAVYSGSIPSGWNYLAVVYTNKQPKIYLNGRLVRTGLTSPKTNVYAPIQICGGTYGYHNGSVDEVRISNVVRSSSDIYKAWLEGSHSHSNIQINPDSIVKEEGARSRKIEQGPIQMDKDTAAYWRFEETGGDGAYIKDETINNNDGTPTGTSVSDGLYGKARNFNGSSYITIPASTSLNVGDTMTISVWIKPVDTTRRTIYSHGTNGAGGFQLEINGSGGAGSFGTMINGSYVAYTNGGLLKIGEWNHIAYTRTGSGSGTHALYLNGVVQALAVDNTNSYTSQTADSLIGGRTTGAQLWKGLIDELFISDVAYTANQVYEIYRSGREEYLNEIFTSVDISSASKLQYYIASDKPGTYIESTVGESFPVDSSTIGYWRFEEEVGSGAYIKDSSENSFAATPTGTTVSYGVYGKSRKFNGTSDIMTVAENNVLDPSQITIEAWINPTVLQSGNFVNKGDNSGYRFRTLSAGTVQFLDRGATNNLASVTAVTTGKWWYVVATGDSSGLKIYINGVLDQSNSTAYGSPNTSSDLVFGRYSSSSEYYSGYLDEVKISNVARSSTYIRQEYEKGLRSHSITIDFGASVDSSNYITGPSDTHFAIDATKKGLSQKGSGIYEGDKIIVRENYNGIEYIAQGTVSSVDVTTGAVSVYSWDSGSTFPSRGSYSIYADIFKWQKEYIDLSNIRNDDIDNVSNLVFRLLDGNEGRTIWIDDISASTYLTDPNATANILSTPARYMQYMAIITTGDANVTPYLSSVTINYTVNIGPTMEQLMRHGKWFNSNGVKQNFWWAD